jgi:hypothetical protein
LLLGYELETMWASTGTFMQIEQVE